jgi:hypothetical protein
MTDSPGELPAKSVRRAEPDRALPLDSRQLLLIILEGVLSDQLRDFKSHDSPFPQKLIPIMATWRIAFSLPQWLP